MAPCIEILIAKPTEAYHNDHTLVHPILEIVSAAKGCLGCVACPCTGTLR